jgi:hypothetical protein
VVEDQGRGDGEELGGEVEVERGGQLLVADGPRGKRLRLVRLLGSH